MLEGGERTIYILMCLYLYKESLETHKLIKISIMWQEYGEKRGQETG